MSPQVLSTVTSMLLGLVQDMCPDVRRLALRGLAHYAHLHKTQVRLFLNPLLPFSFVFRLSSPILLVCKKETM